MFGSSMAWEQQQLVLDQGCMDLAKGSSSCSNDDRALEQTGIVQLLLLLLWNSSSCNMGRTPSSKHSNRWSLVCLSLLLPVRLQLHSVG
jgi:hypothetical protein